ncbi:Splicing factor SF3a60-like protein [Vigna angularis]|uniref:Splicing factor SF3a60-like protein n=1 Tax=Phaseolus angularis TaxID=3914 RepID=A0A8T0KJ13_PHAAN|nr:Splicing factor SF3a60-like protein [Vigna angularis]
MSSTVLEVTRAAHEEVERLERLIVKELQNEPGTNKERLYQSHRVRNMIDTITSTTEKLVRFLVIRFFLLFPFSHRDLACFSTFQIGIYEDNDNARKDEIAALGGQTASGINVFSAFYDRLKEEALGRYLDLHELYYQYVNSKFGDPLEYSAYLDVFSDTNKIPRKMKVTSHLQQFLLHVSILFLYFLAGVILNDILHSEKALAALGLKTGGTIQQRAERLFLTKHTPLEKLERKHFAKGTRSVEKNRVAPVPQEDGNSKEIALMEAKMEKLCDLLEETIARTKDNVVKKQALTYEEMEAEREEEETQEDTESEDDEQQIYNPLKLPMGWDGKPIPYWLYKLHGLGQEFKCEICGNYSYWGRRAFERHFKEWRHQHGMRCLGIPNTKNFNEITSIEEAKELWKKIQQRQGVNKWRPDLEEEYEDKEGNIYNKKTYTDLQRQGLI